MKTKNTIWLRLQNNLFQQCTGINGWNKRICLKGMEESHHASENKQELMGKIPGESSEFISSKRLNNSTSQLQKNHGKCLKKWEKFQNSSINHLAFLIELFQSFQELWMMQLPRSTIFRLGSLDMMTIDNLSHAQTVQTINQGILK